MPDAELMFDILKKQASTQGLTVTEHQHNVKVTIYWIANAEGKHLHAGRFKEIIAFLNKNEPPKTPQLNDIVTIHVKAMIIDVNETNPQNPVFIVNILNSNNSDSRSATYVNNLQLKDLSPERRF